MIVPSAEQQIRQGIQSGRGAIAEATATAIELPRTALCILAFALDDALTLLDTLSQELERLKEENQRLLTRSGKPDDHRDFSIHASTDRR